MIKQNDISIMKGFTLLEVVLAITIFAIVTTGLFATFNVGTKSYRRSQEVLNVVQRARFTFEGIGRDLRSSIYADESDYNHHMRNYISNLDNERLKAEENDTLDEFFEKYWGENEDGTFNNPYDVGIMYDLSFEGVDGGEFDSIEMTTYQSQVGYLPTMPWGVSRVKYQVSDGVLLREIKDVKMPPKDINGEEVEDDPPFVEEIADGVSEFDLNYGYFYAGEWLEAGEWDSNAKQFRTPPIEFEEEDPSEDPNYQAKLQMLDGLPDDGIPAYVAVTLGLRDPRRYNKIYRFQTLIRMPCSQETFIPIEFDGEDVDYFAEENLPEAVTSAPVEEN